MAATPRTLILDYTPESLADLNRIWDWNAAKYDNRHADTYVSFLQDKTDGLTIEYARGGIVPTNSTLRYQMIRRNSKRHGHVVVYEISANFTVRILRYFHTAQDWQSKVAARP